MKLKDLTEKIHNFEEDSQWADQLGQWAFYLETLQYFFPDTLDWKRVLDILEQRKGRDVHLLLEDGSNVKIQIKSRRKFYGDICIEYAHEFENGFVKPGWIEEYKDVDFIIYVIKSAKKAYKISFPTLKFAWGLNREDWVELYDLPPAKNPGYNTRNAAVPITVLESNGVVIEEYVESVQSRLL